MNRTWLPPAMATAVSTDGPRHLSFARLRVPPLTGGLSDVTMLVKVLRHADT